MKFTHREVEADKYKPVGSLFMSIMDRDSMPPRVHQNKAARERYNRSLPNLPMSMYPDQPSRAQTPESGRRHFPNRAIGQYTRENSATFVDEERRAQTALRTRRTASVQRHCPDHLGTDLLPRQREETPVRQKRYIPEPRGEGADNTPIRVRLAGGSRRERPSSATPLRHRPGSAYNRDHLGLHTLIPKEEPPKERPTPPPMVLTPRRTGLRMFPEKRSASVGDHRTGVKMVKPPSHWRSATDRQWDFLELGVSARDSPPTRYRNQSNIAVGGGPVPSRRRENPQQQRPDQEQEAPSQRTRHQPPPATSTAPAASTPQPRRLHQSRSPVQRWRGRGSSAAAPPRRSYDIITGRALAY